jgi:hypothetical protein
MRLRFIHLPPLVLAVLLVSTTLSSPQGREQVLDPVMHHFGNDLTPEWKEAPEAPEGSELEFSFDSRANEIEWTLVFTQRNINNRWAVSLNGKEVVVCAPRDDLVEVFHPLPPGTIKNGGNHFRLSTDQPADDITFGKVRLIEAPFREVFDLRAVKVRVTDGVDGPAIPARVTITDGAGELIPIYLADLPLQATRDGVVYTAQDAASFEVIAGEYRVMASRGSEWSMAGADLDLRAPQVDGNPASLHLALNREVDTTGYVACDTHIHTLTFSGHGDSTTEERMVTLAAEGVELAVSTDHNHNTDYRPYQERMGLNAHFTPVVGNEVTTPIGHFNGFPLDPLEEVPAYDLHDAVTVVEGMRAKGAQVVILNHPRWPSHEEGPFGVIGLSHFTGEGSGAPYTEYPFDAMELINSTTEEPEPMLLFEDWFALLNRGERIFAVGSSDSHTVGDPVGGGRTYVPSATDDPALIDVDAACREIAEGRTTISMGIFVTAEVWAGGKELERHGTGALVAPGAGDVTCRVRIQAPGWITPKKASLVVNGTVVREFELPDGSEATDLSLEMDLQRPAGGQDVWCLWVVTGEGVPGHAWPLQNNYTLGATNPIFVDFDSDGVYSSPRATAQKLVAEVGLDLDVLRRRLAATDKAVAYHALVEVRKLLRLQAREQLQRLGAENGRDAVDVERFLDSLGE